MPHGRLATFYAATGETEAARTHAFEGYKKAWADGPPFSHHWDLERCRAVVREIGEPEPLLPPSDPARIEPFPFEPEIHAMLERHAAKQKPRHDKPK